MRVVAGGRARERGLEGRMEDYEIGQRGQTENKFAAHKSG